MGCSPNLTVVNGYLGQYTDLIETALDGIENVEILDPVPVLCGHGIALHPGMESCCTGTPYI